MRHIKARFTVPTERRREPLVHVAWWMTLLALAALLLMPRPGAGAPRSTQPRPASRVRALAARADVPSVWPNRTVYRSVSLMDIGFAGKDVPSGRVDE